MHPFTIDFITGNTPYTETDYNYGFHKEDSQSSVDDSATIPDYFNTTQNLEDIYSVISKDAALSSSPSPGPESYLDQSPSVPARNIPSPKPEFLVDTHEALERGTPSPTQDSGIESTGCSPVQRQSPDNQLAETLENLEKKANTLTKPSSATEKPGLSYIALIAQAILSSRDRKMTLGDIYKHIRVNHDYYDNEDRAWRNSIRYNLSINECFIKAGKEESGKGNFWAIHDQCVTDFSKGDYRRRQARRRARRGTRTLDMEPVNSTIQSRHPVYATMTSSYLGYHPYGNNGMVSVPGYHVSPSQMYSSQKGVFTPTRTATPTYFHGNQMYSGTSGYTGYQSYLTSPYIGVQGMSSKPSDAQKYLQNYSSADSTNSVIIQT